MKTATASTQGLAITSQAEVPLSKKQIQFNKLTKKIEKLRKHIATAEERNQFFMKAMVEYYIPANEALAKARFALALALEEGSRGQRLSKLQKAEIGTCIVDICQIAFETIIPTDEEKALYDRWSETTYDEELEWQQEDEKDYLESIFNEVFGMEIDLDEVRDSPEKLAEIQELIEQKKKENSQGQAKQTKRKTKAQAAKEAKRKAVEDLKSKSLRSIFISLAKLIHPDTEKNPLKRAAKEEEMKKLSAAYEKDDLTTLLAMEMDWIHQQNDHLGSIPEDKLSLYVEVLKDQVRDLEEEKEIYKWDPRYNMIREYTHLKKETGLRRIKSDARELNQAVLDYKRQARSLQGNNSAKKIKEFAKEYLREMDLRYWF